MLLREMQCDCNPMVLLADEYGAIAGLISIEDVLEEIVGNIADGYDNAEIGSVEDLGYKSFRVSARLSIEDVSELYGMEFDDGLNANVVGGLLALNLGRIPLPGAEVVSHGLRLRAENDPDLWGQVQIGTVLLSRAKSDGSDGANGGWLAESLNAKDIKLVTPGSGATVRNVDGRTYMPLCR